MHIASYASLSNIARAGRENYNGIIIIMDPECVGAISIILISPVVIIVCVGGQ